MSTVPARCMDGVKWLRNRHGKGHLAALTGQDMCALFASMHVLDLYACGDRRGQIEAIKALRALVAAIQPGCRVFVKEAIPYVLDWGDVDKLWPQISGEAELPSGE